MNISKIIAFALSKKTGLSNKSLITFFGMDRELRISYVLARTKDKSITNSDLKFLMRNIDTRISELIEIGKEEYFIHEFPWAYKRPQIIGSSEVYTYTESVGKNEEERGVIFHDDVLVCTFKKVFGGRYIACKFFVEHLKSEKWETPIGLEEIVKKIEVLIHNQGGC